MVWAPVASVRDASFMIEIGDDAAQQCIERGHIGCGHVVRCTTVKVAGHGEQRLFERVPLLRQENQYLSAVARVAAPVDQSLILQFAQSDGGGRFGNRKLRRELSLADSVAVPQLPQKPPLAGRNAMDDGSRLQSPPEGMEGAAGKVVQRLIHWPAVPVVSRARHRPLRSPW